MENLIYKGYSYGESAVAYFLNEYLRRFCAYTFKIQCNKIGWKGINTQFDGSFNMVMAEYLKQPPVPKWCNKHIR